MNATAAVAKHFNVTESAVVRCEEWAHVLFCVVRGIGARFVSKKVVGKMEFSQLQGSEKQIAWAEKIRADKMQFVESRLVDAGILSGKAVQFLAEQAKAKFWIENRDASPLALAIFAAGETGHSFTKESFMVLDRLITKEKINGEWVEKTRSEYTSNAIAIRFKKNALNSKTAEMIWVETNISTGALQFGVGEKPQETEDTRVTTLAKILSMANAQGWASQDYQFALIRFASGNYKADFVKEVR